MYRSTKIAILEENRVVGRGEGKVWPKRCGHRRGWFDRGEAVVERDGGRGEKGAISLFLGFLYRIDARCRLNGA